MSNDTGTRLDQVSKFAATALAAIYATGFLIVSLYEAQFGVSTFDLLRPRLVMAGTIFMFMFVLAYVAAHQTFETGWWRRGEAEQTMQEYLLTLPIFLMFCAGIASMGTLYLEEPAPGPTFPLRYSIVYASCIIAAFISGTLLRMWRPNVAATVSVVLLVGMLFCTIHPKLSATAPGPIVSGTTQDWMALWLFCAGVYAVHVQASLAKFDKFKGDWYMEAFLALALVSGYATILYPHERTALGGGAPPDVTIYFRVDRMAGLSEHQTLETKLLDENDHGFYVVPDPRETRAYFVPRDEVEFVKFERSDSGQTGPK